MGHWLASLSIKELGAQYVYDLPLPIHVVVSSDFIDLIQHLASEYPISLTPPIQQIQSKDLHVLRLTSIPSSTDIPSPNRPTTPLHEMKRSIASAFGFQQLKALNLHIGRVYDDHDGMTDMDFILHIARPKIV